MDPVTRYISALINPRSIMKRPPKLQSTQHIDTPSQNHKRLKTLVNTYTVRMVAFLGLLLSYYLLFLLNDALSRSGL
jgi:hypothetical protein